MIEGACRWRGLSALINWGLSSRLISLSTGKMIGGRGSSIRAASWRSALNRMGEASSCLFVVLEWLNESTKVRTALNLDHKCVMVLSNESRAVLLFLSIRKGTSFEMVWRTSVASDGEEVKEVTARCLIV